jgi:hypothetical protein
MLDAPHPRVLFQDVPDPELLGQLQELVGTSGTIAPNASWMIHHSDWDLVVSFAEQPFVGSGMHLLSFGGKQFESFHVQGQLVTPVRSGTLMAREVTVGAKVTDSETKSLVTRSILASDPGPGLRSRLRGLPLGSIPLATVGAEEIAWAAMLAYERPPKIAWALPRSTTNHVEWLAHVLNVLARGDDERFPAEPNWRAGAEWGTPAIRLARAELEKVEAERIEVEADLNRRESESREALELALSGSTSGPQRLLAEDGDELVAAVREALVEFGFDVTEMDEANVDTKGARLEDLRVTVPNDPTGWTCLAEVKGYTKGAKVTDAAQIIGRPVRAYLLEFQKEPDALWHIVNAWRKQNPSTREVAFGSSHDLATLSDNGGCLIDTRDLFRAWRDLDEGLVEAEAVRLSLIAARDRWTWPEVPDPTEPGL